MAKNQQVGRLPWLIALTRLDKLTPPLNPNLHDNERAELQLESSIGHPRMGAWPILCLRFRFFWLFPFSRFCFSFPLVFAACLGKYPLSSQSHPDPLQFDRESDTAC